MTAAAQYSSASMIVITRSVTDGSAGSGEWWVRELIEIVDFKNQGMAINIE